MKRPRKTAFDPAPPGEGGLDNERRFRALVDRVFAVLGDNDAEAHERLTKVEDGTSLDGRYLLLDATNDPVTGNLSFNNALWLQWKTSGGVVSDIMRLSASDNIVIKAISGKNINLTDSAGTSILWVDGPDGRVGIGVTAPTDDLDVDGTVRARSGIRFASGGDLIDKHISWEDYTPTARFGSGGSGEGGSTRVGKYTQIGDIAIVWFVIVDFDVPNSPSGADLYIDLPLTSKHSSGATVIHGVVDVSQITYSGDLVARIDTNSDQVRIRRNASGGAGGWIKDTDVNDGSNRVGMTLIYETSD